MLVEFSVANFRSVKDKITLSMLADGEGFSLLKTAVIYGANASGKSNVLKAINFMLGMLRNRVDVNGFPISINQSSDELHYDCFRLSEETEKAPTHIEVIFCIENDLYRYGFEYDRNTVYKEWLYSGSPENDEETELFNRINEEVKINEESFTEGINLNANLLPNTLFLWKCDQNKGKTANLILKEFAKNINWFDGMKYRKKGNVEYRKKDIDNKVIKILTHLDTDIESISVKENKMEDLGGIINAAINLISNHENISVITTHTKFNSDGQKNGKVSFDLYEEESLGTQKLFHILYPILDALENGNLLLIDEFEASLHPHIVDYLIRLFKDPKINNKNAQLIFATHDTSLLNSGLFDRPEIWITEKDRFGATDLIALLEYKKEEGEDVKKNYHWGKYGGIPNITLNPHDIRGN